MLKDLTPLSPFSKVQTPPLLPKETLSKILESRATTEQQSHEQSLSSLLSSQSQLDGCQGQASRRKEPWSSDAEESLSLDLSRSSFDLYKRPQPQQRQDNGALVPGVTSLASLGSAARKLARLIQTSQLQNAVEQQTTACRQAQYLAYQHHVPPVSAPHSSVYHHQQQEQQYQQQQQQQQYLWHQQHQQQRRPSVWPPEISPWLPVTSQPEGATWEAPTRKRSGPAPSALSFPEAMGPQTPAAGQTERDEALDPAVINPELSESLEMLLQAQRLTASACTRLQRMSDPKSCSKRSRKWLFGLCYDLDRHLGALVSEARHLNSRILTQKCGLCGTTNTPVWRRLESRLVCNACGLKKRRIEAPSAPPPAKCIRMDGLEPTHCLQGPPIKSQTHSQPTEEK